MRMSAAWTRSLVAEMWLTAYVNENEGPADMMPWEMMMPSNVTLCKMDGMSWSGFSAEV